MNVSVIDSLPRLKGFTTIFSLDGQGELRSLFFHKNQIMNEASTATANLWGGYSNYKASAFYFEFQNLADPGDEPSYPTFSAADGVEYYTGLQFSSDKDILRVPILASPAITKTAAGALLTLYAIAPDVNTGYWGRTFSGVANSVIIGGAVVATPGDAQSSDMILCRNYPLGTKVAKTAGEQIGMTWNVEFPFPVIES